MGKKDSEPSSFGAGGRPGREHPDGWSAERRDLKRADDTGEVYGYGKDGAEGWRSTK